MRRPNSDTVSKPRSTYVRNREFLGLPPCGSLADRSIAEIRFPARYRKASGGMGSRVAGPSSRRRPVGRIPDGLFSFDVRSLQDPRRLGITVSYAADLAVEAL